MGHEPPEKAMAIDEKTMRLPLPNGLLYIVDTELFDPPSVDGVAKVWRTESCIVLSCQGDMDGPTEIRINPAKAPGPELSRLAAFDQAIPSRRLVLMIVPGDVIHEMPLDRREAHIEVWTTGRQGTPVVWLRIE